MRGKKSIRKSKGSGSNGLPGPSVDEKTGKASKKDTGKPSSKNISSANSFRELDEILRNSFSAIKKDMLQLQEVQHQQMLQLKETRQEMNSTPGDYVTIDKFNVIKIKIGELNESMKKLWEIDKKLIEVDAKTLSEADFDKQSSEWENEFEKIRQDITEMRSSTVGEEQLNRLVQDINEEFDSIKDHLDELRRIKDSIKSAELEKRTQSISQELEDLRSDFRKERAAEKDLISARQVEALIEDINGEFDDVRGSIASLSSGLKGVAKTSELKKETAQVEARLTEIKKSMSDLQNQQRGFIRKEQVEVLLDDINKEFDDIKAHIADTEGNIKSTLKTFVSDSVLKKRLDRLSGQLERLKKDLSEKDSQMKQMRTLLEKDYLNLKQAENLVEDVNSEFDDLKSQVRSLNDDLGELRKGLVSQKAVDKRFKRLELQLERSEKGLSASTKAFEAFRKGVDRDDLKKTQAEHLVEDVNREFDSVRLSVKSNSNDIDTVRKNTDKKLRDYVKRKELQDELEALRSVISGIQTELSSGLVPTKKFNKISTYFKKSIHSLESDYVSRDRFNALVDELDRVKAMMKRGTVVGATPKLAKLKARNNVPLEKVKPSKEFVPLKKSYFVGNTLIVLAFLMLVASIVLFFLGQLDWTDKLAMVSVGAFVIGLIIRITVIVKRSKLVENI